MCLWCSHSKQYLKVDRKRKVNNLRTTVFENTGVENTLSKTTLHDVTAEFLTRKLVLKSTQILEICINIVRSQSAPLASNTSFLLLRPNLSNT